MMTTKQTPRDAVHAALRFEQGQAWSLEDLVLLLLGRECRTPRLRRLTSPRWVRDTIPRLKDLAGPTLLVKRESRGMIQLPAGRRIPPIRMTARCHAAAKLGQRDIVQGRKLEKSAQDWRWPSRGRGVTQSPIFPGSSGV